VKVTPGIGMGSLIFGMSRDAVRARLGLPESIEDRSEEIEETIAWYYEAPECSVYFDVDADLRLTTIDTCSASTELAGHHPIGMSEDDAIRVYSAAWPLELGEDLKELGRRQYDLIGTGVWLWFQDGECCSVQASVIIGADDEFVWPLIQGG